MKTIYLNILLFNQKHFYHFNVKKQGLKIARTKQFIYLAGNPKITANFPLRKGILQCLPFFMLPYIKPLSHCLQWHDL